MKKRLKKKIFIMPLIIVIAVLSLGGAVYAAYAITVPGQVNIVAATNDIKVYSTPNYTFELAKIIWDDLPIGGERCRDVYIKNLGNTDAKVVVTLQGAPAGVGLKAGTSALYIEAGSQSAFSLCLEATTTTQTESSSFTLTFTSTPIYVNP